MTLTRDPARPDRGGAGSGRLPDEDLDAVTGGLLRPPVPHGCEDQRIEDRPEAGHGDDADP